MSTAVNTSRRWLRSAINAASTEQVTLPWAAKRVQRPAQTAPATAIRIYPSAPAHYAAIAAR